MRDLNDFFLRLEEMHAYLEKRGVSFTQEGFAELDKSCFLHEWPDEIVDFQHRGGSIVKDRKRTVICHFAPDKRIYPRIDKVLDELDEYRGYMGAAMFDVTVTWDMELEFQASIMLLNQLAMSIQAVNGIKVMPNLRSGAPGTEGFLESFPSGLIWVSGSLGCSRLSHPSDASFISKVLALRPMGVAIYGKKDVILERQLDDLGIEYRRYPDSHARYKTR